MPLVCSLSKLSHSFSATSPVEVPMSAIAPSRYGLNTSLNQQTLGDPLFKLARVIKRAKVGSGGWRGVGLVVFF